MYDGIRLPHSMNRITFDFLSICLVNPAAVKYQFMLVGNDEDWISTDQTSAMYSSISPGKYTFMVRASNNYGYWNETPVTHGFHHKSSILPDFLVHTTDYSGGNQGQFI
ncbi:MAG: hypothetical protein MZW92_68475 [Comamonadaceae bacterium]|nr:hypothetical protein [Comamonadaceae bacterium]